MDCMLIRTDEWINNWKLLGDRCQLSMKMSFIKWIAVQPQDGLISKETDSLLLGMCK